MEKKLRIFDLADEKPRPSSPSPNAPLDPVTLPHSRAFEIGEGVHKDAIKFIVWTRIPTTLITAAGKTLRWFDIPSKSCIKEEVLGGDITSCELVSLAQNYSASSDIGGGLPVLSVASGKTVSFWGGDTMTEELKRFTLGHGAASVGLDLKGRKFVVGEDPGTWVRVYTWEEGKEIGESRAPAPPRLSRYGIDPFPQTYTRATTDRPGRWHTRPMASCTRRDPKTAPSRCGRTATASTGSGEVGPIRALSDRPSSTRAREPRDAPATPSRVNCPARSRRRADGRHRRTMWKRRCRLGCCPCSHR